MAESQTSTRVCATPGCSCRLQLRDRGEASLDASSCLLHAQRASGAKGSGGWRDGVCGLCQPAAGLRITFAPPTSRPASSAAGSSAAGGRYGELVYLLAFEDVAQRERAWQAFTADPEWRAAYEESERDGLIVSDSENRLLAPTDFSPLA